MSAARGGKLFVEALGTPVPHPVTAIAAGFEHTCALMADFTVRCWGNNSHGELGDGTTTTPPTPVTAVGLR